jgi:predicted O-linked N-acetylglucosamine transferase (SPINDLY family)
MRRRLQRAFDHFIEVGHLSDEEIARRARELGIDIAIDLKGYTRDDRAGIFACRCAPIQVNYLGYPGTMGTACMDYVVADPTLIPADAQQHYSEKIAYLPHTYQANDRKREISGQAFSRHEMGLPSNGFVFCCFNNNYKITPDRFDIWMRLLKAKEGSVLWLLEDNPLAANHLRLEAATRGVSPERLIFAPRRPLAEHLARHQAADLFLDTLPYNAHTTASDALWAGLPVLTQMGASFASRVAASLLQALGLPELITTTDQAYEQLALELANHPDRLHDLKQKLASQRLSAPLFDTTLFTHHFEAALKAMQTRHLAGLPPEHIQIPA